MKHFLLPALALALLSSCSSSKNESASADSTQTPAATPPRQLLARYHWLVGSWSMATPAGTLFEVWTQANDSTLTAEDYMYEPGGAKTLIENIELRSRGGNLFYVPTMHGQNDDQPVEFAIVATKDSSFVAENPQHPYPERIVYEHRSPASLYARIEGKEDGKPVFEEFVMAHYTEKQ